MKYLIFVMSFCCKMCKVYFIVLSSECCKIMFVLFVSEFKV